MGKKLFFRKCKLFFRNKAVSETVENMLCCINSGNLAEKQISLAKTIKGMVNVFNGEIGQLGGGSIREILRAQNASGICGEIPSPFRQEVVEGVTCLEILLGKVPEGDRDMPVSIAFSKKRRKWYYTGRSGNDLIFSDVLEFTGEEIRTAVRVLSCAIIILSEVYKTPDGPMDVFVTKIDELQLAGPGRIILLPESNPEP